MNNPSWLAKVLQKHGVPKSRRRLVAICVGIFLLTGVAAYGAELGFRKYSENAVIVSATFGFLAILGSLLKRRGLWMLASAFLGILFGSLLLTV